MIYKALLTMIQTVIQVLVTFGRSIDGFEAGVCAVGQVDGDREGMCIPAP